MSEVRNLETGENRTVVGMFDHVDQAENAINDLKLAGFTPDSISVVTRGKPATEAAETEADEPNEAGQGALAGAIGGGTLGAVLGWLLAGGTALIPGIGPIVAAGIFGATVSGALIGGTLGGVSGALVGQGVPQEDAEEYESYMKDGRTLVTVRPANGQQVEAVYDVFNRNGANMVRRYVINMARPDRATTEAEGASSHTSSVDNYRDGNTYVDEYSPDDEARRRTTPEPQDRDNNLPPTAVI
jgi:hypothetical protein